MNNSNTELVEKQVVNHNMIDSIEMDKLKVEEENRSDLNLNDNNNNDENNLVEDESGSQSDDSIENNYNNSKYNASHDISNNQPCLLAGESDESSNQKSIDNNNQKSIIKTNDSNNIDDNLNDNDDYDASLTISTKSTNKQIKNLKIDNNIVLEQLEEIKEAEEKEEVELEVEETIDVKNNRNIIRNNNNYKSRNSNSSNSTPVQSLSPSPKSSNISSPSESISSSINLNLNKNIVYSTNTNNKMSPGLAKRVATSDSNNSLNSNHHLDKLTASSSSSDTTTATISSNISHNSGTSTSNQQQANLKIQNALERNMQKLNHFTKKSNNNKNSSGVNLTKEEIELFTSNQQQQEYQQYHQQHLLQQYHYHKQLNNFSKDSLSSTPEHNNHSQISNLDSHKFHLLAQQQQLIINQNVAAGATLMPDSTSYYLNRLPNNSQLDHQSGLMINDLENKYQLVNNKINTSNLLAKNILNRKASTDREMTPDSIDLDNSENMLHLKNQRKKQQILQNQNRKKQQQQPNNLSAINVKQVNQMNNLKNKQLKQMKKYENNNLIAENENENFSYSPSSMSSSNLSSPQVKPQSNKNVKKKLPIISINNNYNNKLRQESAIQKLQTTSKPSKQKVQPQINKVKKVNQSIIKNKSESEPQLINIENDYITRINNKQINKKLANNNIVKPKKILPVLEEGLSNDELEEKNNHHSHTRYDHESSENDVDSINNDEPYDDQDYVEDDEGQNQISNQIENDDLYENNQDGYIEEEQGLEVNENDQYDDNPEEQSDEEDEQEEYYPDQEELYEEEEQEEEEEEDDDDDDDDDNEDEENNHHHHEAYDMNEQNYELKNNKKQDVLNRYNNIKKTNNTIQPTTSTHSINAKLKNNEIQHNPSNNSKRIENSNRRLINSTASVSSKQPISTSQSMSTIDHSNKNSKSLVNSKTSNSISNNSRNKLKSNGSKDYDTDEETNKLLARDDNHLETEPHDDPETNTKQHNKSKEINVHQMMDPDHKVLIEGVLFRARYLGSTQLITDGNPTKLTRMLQAQEAVGRIKAPEGESQPSVEVDLFVSTEKIMVLNTDLQEIMMDHSLRSISYIADIGNLVVLMAKRRTISNNNQEDTNKRQIKMICHVFESEEAQVVAQSIGQAFQVAYMEYLKANGIEDMSIMKDLDYQEVLNQQEIMGDELLMFARKECQKEVIIPKAKNEPLGIVIVESGWGSMLPTVVVANMMPTGPAARCGNLNIGDQIISVNGISMVGLPLASCQNQIKSLKHLTIVRLVVVPCPPVVEVLIKRPDTKYQLGFSVQDGIICSLLRGGIAERGGVRVGHRIIEINNQSVVATTHEKIVNILANSVGELRMKTMPTQMFRLLTGQEAPNYI